MFELVGAAAANVCNLHWGFLTIILAYLAFLCYWMVFKKHRELDLVAVIASAVYCAIYFILAFFINCPVCGILMIVGVLILDIVYGYYLFTDETVVAFINKVVFKKAPVEEKKEEAAVSVIPPEDVEIIYEEEGEAEKTVFYVDEVTATDGPEEGASLKESFSIMDALVSQSKTSKKHICDYLTATYGDKVVINSRPNRTKNDRLPMADTHYVIVGGKKVCFLYVYQNAAGGVLILVKTNKDHYKMIAEKHAGVKRSAFPRRGEWYSIIVDDTYAEEEIYKIISDAYEINRDGNFQPTDWTFHVVKSVKASEVGALISAEVAGSMIEKSQRVVDRKKKGFVNVGQLNQYFSAGETVNLEEIKKRIPKVDKNMTFCKLLAHGVLDKPLTVDLDDYSVDAVKMVVITGGKVIKPQK